MKIWCCFGCVLLPDLERCLLMLFCCCYGKHTARSIAKVLQQLFTPPKRAFQGPFIFKVQSIHITVFTAMASRPSSMHMRAPSLGPGGSTSAPQLQQKIQEKRQELQDLRTLRELSGTLAKQMEDLAQKLETLTDGTAAVATVMANWGSVLRAVRLASGMFIRVNACGWRLTKGRAHSKAQRRRGRGGSGERRSGEDEDASTAGPDSNRGSSSWRKDGLNESWLGCVLRRFGVYGEIGISSGFMSVFWLLLLI